MTFAEYMGRFEVQVIAKGIDVGCLGKKEIISVRDGKLAASPFARKMGRLVPHSAPFAVDYYGYVKKSNGLLAYIGETQREFSGAQIKGIPAAVVHFAAIRVEKIAKLAPELVADFPRFKKEILDARGFQHKYEI